MKIISKHKDYYDYLQGIYGMDEVMTYDRRTDNLIRRKDIGSGLPGEYLTHEFAICNKVYTLFEYKRKVYHTVDEIIELDRILKKDNKAKYDLLDYGRWSWRARSEQAAADNLFKESNHDTDVNKIIRQPVLINTGGGEFTHTKVKEHKSGYYRSSSVMDTDKKESTGWSIPILKEFGLAKYYKADQLYQDVSAFIAWTKDHPEIPNKQTNDEKIHSHGFDKKVSFRHRKD